MRFEVEPARPADLAAALDLLREAELPEDGVVESFGHYLVVRDDERLVGLCGLEVHGSDGLLRSVAVAREYRGEGVGAALVEGALALAPKLGVETLYLLTTTARDFFLRHGFVESARDRAPSGIRDSWEFRTGCPSTSTLMRRAVEPVG
jgi:amino-acid N-acetyltransferase